MRVAPVSPMKARTSASMRQLAARIQQTFPETVVHQHIRDAAQAVDSGRYDGAQRHLNAAIATFTPQNLHRHGISDDEGYVSAKSFMHETHRHLLLVKDIQDVAGQNAEVMAARREAMMSPAMRNAQPIPIGRSDRAAEGPASPQPTGSKQFTATSWEGVSNAIELAFNPMEKRGKGGRWTVGGAGSVDNVITQDSGHPDKSGSLGKKLDGMLPGERTSHVRNGRVYTIHKRSDDISGGQFSIKRVVGTASKTGYSTGIGMSNPVELVGPKGYSHGWVRASQALRSAQVASEGHDPVEAGIHLNRARAAVSGKSDKNSRAIAIELRRAQVAREGHDPVEAEMHMMRARRIAAHAARTTVQTANDQAAVELVGPKGYEHGWKYVGVPKYPYQGRPGDMGHIRAIMATANRVRPVSGTAANALENAGRAVATRRLDAARMHLSMAMRELRHTGSHTTILSIAKSLDNVPKGTYPRLPYARHIAPQSLRRMVSSGKPGYYENPDSTIGASWADVDHAIELSAQTGALASTPHPLGSKGLWGVEGMQLPPYIQNIARALMRKRGMDESKAIAIARAATKKWGAGGGKVHPEVREASQKTSAEWSAKQARAHAHSNAWDKVSQAIELATAIELFNPAGNPAQARVAAGSATGGQFTPGGQSGQQSQGNQKPTPHQQHMAHMNHLQVVAKTKAGLLSQAAQYRSQAAALGTQITSLNRAIKAARASAAGKTSKGQKGAKTAANATTKATGTAATATATKTAAAKTAAKKTAGTATKTSYSKLSLGQMLTMLKQLTAQRSQLLQAAAAATAKAATVH